MKFDPTKIYGLSGKSLQAIYDALDNNQFRSGDGDDEYNNDDVQDAMDILEKGFPNEAEQY